MVKKIPASPARLDSAKRAGRQKRKKIQREVFEGKIFINSSFNNTLITITDLEGNVLSWASAGTAGFKGTRKSTPFASQQATKLALEKVKPYGLKRAQVFVSGVGSGRESAVRVLPSTGIKITKIRDITPIPHNGPKPKKPRRV